MPKGFFVTGPGTGEGKTFVTRALAAALHRSGKRPIALKPIETGVSADPLDALALERASGRATAVTHSAFFRNPLPLSPYAATLETGGHPLEIAPLVTAVRALATDGDFTLVEGAGGLLVPLNATQTIAELAAALELPLLFVAADRLGVLSSVLACAEAARQRRLSLAALVLSDHGRASDDLSSRTNRRILEQRLTVPVFAFPACADDDAALAHAAIEIGLLRFALDP